MLEKFFKIFLIFLIPLKIFSQDFITIHSSRDKTTLLKVEKLGNKYFIFYHDSSFFDKRIKCKVFDKNNPTEFKEFFLTPNLSTFQDELKLQVISERLIFLAFLDFRTDPDGDIYSQLIDENGILWDSGGIPICTQKGVQKNFTISSDNENIFLVWEDYRNDPYSDIYAQKLDFYGNLQWKENGIVVSNLEGVESEPQVASDNSGGCYISWIEKILKVNKIYIQYLNSSGKKLFGQFGIFTSNPEANAIQNFLFVDGKNEPIIFYTERKNNSKIYFQKFSKKGSKKMGFYGKELWQKSENQELISVIKFSQNDFVILFLSEEKSNLKSFYAQILSQGEKLKFKNPIKMHSNCKFHQMPDLSTNQSGFFIFWTCYHNSLNQISLFIQTLTPKGEMLKLEGLKLTDENLNLDSKYYLFFENQLTLFTSNLNKKNGIYFAEFYLKEYQNPKVQNFRISQYEGLVKINWELINEQPRTKIILEKFNENDSSWIEIYSYNSNSRSPLKQMNFDDHIFENSTAKYRIKCIDPDGNEKLIEEEIEPESVTDGFFLFQNSPNPFSKTTKIAFRIPFKTRVVIKLYNSRLEEIETILDEVRESGVHEIEFEPSTLMENGIYFYRMSSSGFYDVKKMIYSK